MADDNEYYKELIKTLKKVTRDMTKEQLDAASLLVEFIKLQQRKDDYEGKQIFFIQDYKRRN